jgi:hypothetical protein
MGMDCWQSSPLLLLLLLLPLPPFLLPQLPLLLPPLVQGVC